jgi:small GTP-binding protein
MMELVLVGRSNVGKSSVIRRLTGKRVRVGKRPGVTRRISRYSCGKLDVVDMPGFGFMAGVSSEQQERTKTEIVRYLEQNRERVLFAIEVVDARAFSEIVEQWERRGQIPVDIEMFSFLKELGLNPIVVVNKIDLIYSEERDGVLDDICEKLGMPSPWRQWPDVVVPISAKTGDGVSDLMRMIGERLRTSGQGHLLKYLRGRVA